MFVFLVLFRWACLHPFTAIFAAPSLGNRPIKAKFETIQAFLSPSHEHVKGFLSKCTVFKVDLLYDRQIRCLEECVCVCTFQPGNSTGLGSEGVNGTLVPRLNSVNLGKKNVVHFPVLSSGSRHYAAIWAL